MICKPQLPGKDGAEVHVHSLRAAGPPGSHHLRPLRRQDVPWPAHHSSRGLEPA